MKENVSVSVIPFDLLIFVCVVGVAVYSVQYVILWLKGFIRSRATASAWVSYILLLIAVHMLTSKDLSVFSHLHSLQFLIFAQVF